MNISEKNETKAMHIYIYRISFRTLNSANGKVFQHDVITTVNVQNGRKLTLLPIYFTNEFGDHQFSLRLNISFS